MTTQPGSDTPTGATDDPWLFSGLSADSVSKELRELLLNRGTQYAVMTLDRGGVVTNWNTGAERIHGYSADEILGRNFAAFYTEEDARAGEPRRALETALRAGKYEAEAWRVRKDGRRFMARVLIEPLRDDFGDLLGFAKLTRYSQRGLHPHSSSNVAASLPQSPRNQYGTLLHDLNNSLQIINNGLELLRKLQAAGSDTTGVIDVMTRNAASAAVLAQRLQELSRSTPREARPINLNTLVAGMVESLRHVLSEGIAIETVLGSGLSRVSADPGQVQSVLLNLAIHARDAMSHRGRLRIETRNVVIDDAYTGSHRGVVPGRYVMIGVANTGTCMTREIIAKAFEGFVAEQNEGAASDGPEVYGFIEQLNAHVRIHSEPSTGTAIKFYLPELSQVHASEESGAPPRPAFPNAVTTRSDEDADTLRGLRVVVIEDEALIRMHVEDLVVELGGKVVASASSVSEGLDVVDRTEMDLALLDVNLTGEHVYPVAESLRARGIPFLFMSGYGEVEAKWRERPVLQKPLELEKLRQAARLALGRSS